MTVNSTLRKSSPENDITNLTVEASSSENLYKVVNGKAIYVDSVYYNYSENYYGDMDFVRPPGTSSDYYLSPKDGSRTWIFYDSPASWTENWGFGNGPNEITAYYGDSYSVSAFMPDPVFLDCFDPPLATSTPEPGTVLLTALGICTILVGRKRRMIRNGS